MKRVYDKGLKRMEFVELTQEEFGQYTKENFSHFTQTLDNYRLKQDEGTESYLVGLKHDGEVKAACLVTLGRVMKFFNFAYTNRGPVLDYSDEKIVKAFFRGLESFLKNKKVVYLRVDPYVVLNVRDHDGNILEEKDSHQLFDTFKNLGYDHDGFTVGFSPDTQIRWHSTLDLKDKTEKEIFNDFDQLRKRNIKKAEKDGIKVKYLDLDDIDIFTDFMEDTSEMKEFFDRGPKFYKSRKQYFGDNVMIPLAYVDLNEYVDTLQSDVQKMQRDLNKAEKQLERHPDNKKAQNKVKNFKEQLANIEKKLEEGLKLRETHGEELPVAASYYINTPHEVAYLAGGTANEFRHFAGSYSIQWEMIKYAIEHGVDIYNFYGISGKFTEDAEDYGVIQFKKGFNATVNEYIGDFVKPINKTLDKLYHLLKR